MIDWSLYPNFTEDEFRCRGTDCCDGRADMHPIFLALLQAARSDLGFALNITSGYRCPVHNARVSSTGERGPHTTGKAGDIAISRQPAFFLLGWAMAQKAITGIGLKQHGSSRFIHLDILTEPEHAPRPTIWSYA